MPRKPGDLYLPVDVEFMDNDRIVEAGEKAAWLYLGMCLRSKRLLSDGKLSRRQIDRLPIKGIGPRLTALVKAGLVAELPGDYYLIVGWVERNATSDQLEAKAAASVLANHTRWHVERNIINPRCEHCTIPNGVRNGSGPDPKSDPKSDRSGNPKTETETETETETVPTDSDPDPDPQAGKPAKRATRIPDTWPRNPEHAAQLVDWATESAPLVDLRHESDQWQDWHRAHGTVAKDWTASWRTWMRKAQKDAERRSTSRNGNSPTPPRIAHGDAYLRDAMERALEAEAATATDQPALEGRTA